jgi:hypothetical protein
LRAGDPQSKAMRLQTSADEHVVAFLRKNENDEVLVLLNFSSADVEFSLNEISGKFKEVFLAEEKDISNNRNFKMKGWEYLVFEKLR